MHRLNPKELRSSYLVVALALAAGLTTACGSEIATPARPAADASATVGDAGRAADAAPLGDTNSATDGLLSGAADADGADGGVSVQPAPWTLIALPDTQNYSSGYPDVFDAQTSWIASRAALLNIRYVVNEGDLVYESVDEQWTKAAHSLRMLDNIVPYALVLGNHDYPGSGGSADSRDTTLFDKYFPLSSMKWEPGLMETFAPDSLSNSYHQFRAGGRTWLLLMLEFGPRDGVLAWADAVLKANPSTDAIVVTHAYLALDGTRFDHATRTDQDSNPHYYSGVADLPGGVNDGEEIWQKLIVGNPNVRLVLCGHMHAQKRLTSPRAFGPPVHQILADYQADDGGGGGYLRIMTFQADGTVDVRSYSPYLDSYRVDPENQFTLQL